MQINSEICERFVAKVQPERVRKIMLLSEFPFMDDKDIPVYPSGNRVWGEGVYFVADLEEMLIKIGRSSTPKQRLWQLRTERPHLKMMAYFRDGYEDLAHYQFDSLRVKGEWFAPSPRLLNSILDQTAGIHPPSPATEYLAQMRARERAKAVAAF